MIDVRSGCFCQPVRWLECLMFSLLVALLCIFLCQRRSAIWTARALQKPAGHPSSSWRPECSASAECWWFVMTWEPADRQVSYKKTCTHFPFVVQWKHHCSCNGGGGGAPDSCIVFLIWRQDNMKCFARFSSTLTLILVPLLQVWVKKKRGITILSCFFIFIIFLESSICRVITKKASRKECWPL